MLGARAGCYDSRMRAVVVALVVLCVAGCGSSGMVPGHAGGAPFTAAAAGGLTVTPVRDGYLRGDAKGLALWGSRPWEIAVATGDTAARVAVTSKNPAMLSVVPAGGRNRLVLQAQVVDDTSTTCAKCRIVKPGTVVLRIVVAAAGQPARTYHVPVTIAHKIIAVSLNPLPNPSLGSADAVLQYYDDNVSPSVVWDDIDLHNATSFPNVGGLAFGPDGALYVANSGVAGYSNGTVTEYAPQSTKASPIKTFASSSLRSAAAVALDARGNLYVADNGFETVSRFPVKGAAVTWHPGWEAGAAVTGVAVDAARGYLDVTMSCVGDYYPPHKTKVGRLTALPLNFTTSSAPLFTIDSNSKNGVNEPYGVAVDGTGRAFVVNDYVSIVEGPPGPGPEYSTLTTYGHGISSGTARPDATASRTLRWPLSVAADVAGNVYVANNTPPSQSGNPGTMWLVKYDGGNLQKRSARIDLSAGMPADYGPYYLNIQGIAVEPSPLRR